MFDDRWAISPWAGRWLQFGSGTKACTSSGRMEGLHWDRCPLAAALLQGSGTDKGLRLALPIAIDQVSRQSTLKRRASPTCSERRDKYRKKVALPTMDWRWWC